jgi:hypothetical protein
MSRKHTKMKPCPRWCTGTHDLITPDGECVHGSSPAILVVNGGLLEVRIEAYVENAAVEPPPGQITWDFSGAETPSMTAAEARSFVTILSSLISELGKAERAPERSPTGGAS